MATQPRDTNNNMIIQGARIKYYLGSADGDDMYVLALPEGTANQYGPYEMRMEAQR